MAAKSSSGNCIFNWFVCSFRNSFFLVIENRSERTSGYCSDFSPVMLHTEKMSDEKKSDQRDRGDDLTMRRTNVPPWVYVSFSRIPNASKTTNIIVTVKKYIHTVPPYLVRRETFPLARLFIFVRCCWAVMSRLIGIYNHTIQHTFLSGILNIARV